MHQNFIFSTTGSEVGLHSIPVIMQGVLPSYEHHVDLVTEQLYPWPSQLPEIQQVCRLDVCTYMAKW